MNPDDVRDSLVLRRDHAAIGTESVLRGEIADGGLRRIATGVYAPTSLWDRLDDDGRFRLVVHAAALRFPGDVFSHRSAAALWRLPIVGSWPPFAEATIERTSGGRSRAGLVRHAIGMPDPVEIVDGVRVSGLARTVSDAAHVSPVATGVAFADAALRRVSRDALREALSEVEPARGRARAARVVEFADAGAESAGESLSRVVIDMVGFERPDLQTELFDDAGLIGRVDFFWPGQQVVGEFDGAGKYLRAELRDGRTTAQVVVDEKRREDRLRRMGHRVVRWGWSDARSPRRLEALLAGTGVPRRRKP